jgi:threonine synthase
MGLELAEQLGWDVPDAIFYPTGGGTGLIGMWKAFAELEAIGFIGKKRPKMFAVQAARRSCGPSTRASNTPRAGTTRTRSRRGFESPRRSAISSSCARCARAVDGRWRSPMRRSMRPWQAAGRDHGLLRCPEGAATLAAVGVAREQRWLAPDASVVLFNCASGYKYPLPGEARTLDRHAPIDYASL